MTTNRRHYRAFRSDHFVNNLGENSPKSPLLPNSPFSPDSPTFRDPYSWVNLFALIISPTTLAIGEISPEISKFRQTWRNFARIAIFASPCISGHISFNLLQMVYIRKERESFLHCSPFEHRLCSRPAFITSKELSPSNH